MLRDITQDERAVLEWLLSQPFPGCGDLVRQLPYVRTSGSSCSCGCPTIALIVDRQAPVAAVTERVPAEAAGCDRNGNLVGILLFVDDGHLSELEFYSIAGPDIEFTELDSLTPVVWSYPDKNGNRTQLNDMPS